MDSIPRVRKEQIPSRGNTPYVGLERRRSLEREKSWEEAGVSGAWCPGRRDGPDEAGMLRRWGGATANKALRILDCIVQATRNH